MFFNVEDMLHMTAFKSVCMPSLSKRYNFIETQQQAVQCSLFFKLCALKSYRSYDRRAVANAVTITRAYHTAFKKIDHF